MRIVLATSGFRGASQGLKFETYVNNEYGFSIKYDANLLDMDGQPVSPIIFIRRGLKGLPVFAALVDDIPQGMVKSLKFKK